MNDLLKLAKIFLSRAQLLRPGESTMARKTAIETLSNLRDVIHQVLSMKNNVIELAYLNESNFLIEFLNSALAGNYGGLNKKEAKDAIHSLGAVLSNYINVQDAIKAIDYFDQG